MEWATKGTAALSASNAAQAVQYFTQALVEHPHSPDYFTKRATAFTRLKPARNDLALRDAEYAVLLARKRANREKIQAGQQRRVVALYGLGRFEDADFVLGTMLKWRRTGDAGKSDQMEHAMWSSKIASKVKVRQDTATASDVTVQEYPDVELPSEKAIKAWLQAQVKSGSFDTDINDTVATAATADKTKATDEGKEDEEGLTEAIREARNPSSTTKPAIVVQPVRQDFYQNNDNLIVTFYAKKVDPATFDCTIRADAVKLTFPHPDDKSTPFTFTAAPLHALIDPTKSTSKVYGTKVELTLAKEQKGIKWPSLEAAKDGSGNPISTGLSTSTNTASESISTSTSKTVTTGLPNPYASKNNTDWDKKAAELTKKAPKTKKIQKPADDANDDDNDEDGDDDSDLGSDYGGDKVDGFFKKLYAGADEDTRRAMMKSFYESNGTALSTNWADVSKGKVEEVLPKDEK